MSQTKPVKIVFDVTSSDTLTHQARAAPCDKYWPPLIPQSTFEVVVYGRRDADVCEGKI